MVKRFFYRIFVFLSCVSLASACIPFGWADPSLKDLPAAASLRDRFWIWGHGEGTLNGKYGLSSAGSIGMVEAADYMNIPNVCVICWLGKPDPPFAPYLEKLERVRNFGWSIVDSAPELYIDKKNTAFSIAASMPNFSTLFLDDFFVGDASPAIGSIDSAAKLNIETLAELYVESHAIVPPLDVALVVYSHQIRPEIMRYVTESDLVCFWTWNANDLPNLEDNFRRYRALFPDKRTMLGIYMWNFGGQCSIPLPLMEYQCELARTWLKQGKIEGAIFHCTPLCDKNLEAVEWARQWIQDVGGEVIN